MRKLHQILYYVGLSILIIGIACTILSFVVPNENLSNTFGIIAALAGPIALVLLVIRLILIIKVNPVQAQPRVKEVKTVDVKPIKKTKEEELYDQYVDLYNKKLITKEELDAKRIELLGK